MARQGEASCGRRSGVGRWEARGARRGGGGLESEGGKPQWSGVWSQQVEVTGETFEQTFDVKETEVKPYKPLLKEGEADEDAPLY